MRKNKFLVFVLTMLVGMNAWALIPRPDGTYVLRTGNDLYEFAKLVDAGNLDINAVVAADIDYTAYNKPIGIYSTDNSNSGKCYKGTFDGQNHKITVNLDMDRSQVDGQGFFCSTDPGCVVKNLWLAGTIKGNGRRMAPLGKMVRGTTVTNCLFQVDLISTWNSSMDSDWAGGGVMGQGEGQNILTNVVVDEKVSCKNIGGTNAEGKAWFGGICGWVEDGCTEMNNCAVIIESIDVDDASTGFTAATIGKHGPLTRHDPNLAQPKNCYWYWPTEQASFKDYFEANRQDGNANEPKNGTQVTMEQVKSGELAYLLSQNAEGSNVPTTFTQDIGVDTYIVPFEAHDKVLRAGDGSYTNYDGFYNINSAEKLYLFAQMVGKGGDNLALNAKVSADIDYTGYNLPIGLYNTDNTGSGKCYKGTFDGQGHTIKINLNLDRSQCDGQGFFCSTDAGCVVKNLTLTGTLKGNGRRMAPLGKMVRGTTVTNCAFLLDIISTWNSSMDSDWAGGGVMGQGEGQNILTNVVVDETVSCMNIGGTNAEGKAWFGGICGWVEDGCTEMNNCAVIIEKIEVDEASTGFTAATIGKHGPLTRHDPNLAQPKNCYWYWPTEQASIKDYFEANRQDGNANEPKNGTQITLEQARNGELGYLLNGSKEDGVFCQNIGSDNCPVPFSEGHSPIHNVNGKFSNFDEAGFIDISTAKQLNDFMKLVNAGNYSLNARLTADIDYRPYGRDANNIIGGDNENTQAYLGEFDGQGHKITVETYHSNAGNTQISASKHGYQSALFTVLGPGAIVKNLWIDGYLEGDGRRLSGLAREVYGCNVSNTVISLDLVSTLGSGEWAGGGFTGWTCGNNMFKNCVFKGSFKAAKCTNPCCAGITGWQEDGCQTLDNCLVIIEGCDYAYKLRGDNNEPPSHAIFSRHSPGQLILNNCWYYVDDTHPYLDWITIGGRPAENDVKANMFKATPEQIANGEVCYKLNGNQTTLNFFQTLSEDIYPVPFEEGHEQVYLREGNYTNSDAEVIKTAEDLANFFNAVNAGNKELNGKLGADIDFTAYPTLVMDHYAGTFDGNGYKILFDTKGLSGDHAACFALTLDAGANIKNLWIDGQIHGDVNQRRISTLARDCYGVIIQNVVSTVDIFSDYDGGSNDLASGGFLGWCEGAISLINCVYYGTIQNIGTQDPDCGGFCGWVEGGQLSCENCLAIMSVDIPEEQLSNAECPNPFARVKGHDERINCKNCYYVDLIPNIIKHNLGKGYTCPDCHEVSMDDVKSGKVAFMLNNNQTKIGFWQTLGTDDIPYPVKRNSKQVYGKGQIACNGIPYGSCSFSNVSPNEIDKHQFESGICKVCGAEETESELELDEEGYYMISSTSLLEKVMDFVNSGNVKSNVRLYADIDFTAEKYEKKSFNSFAGIFDGQGHSVTVKMKKASASFFGSLAGTVHDFILKGEIINIGEAGGGLSATTGKCLVENCVVEADIVSEYSGSNGPVKNAGFLGYTRENATLNNCVFAGRMIQHEGFDFRQCAAFVGRNNVTVNLRNCVVAGEMIGEGGDCGTFGGNAGTLNMVNCFYTTLFAGNSNGATAVDPADAAKGILCYNLNGGAYDNPTWRQNIGEDKIPYPLGDKGIVYRTNAGAYYDVHDVPTMSTFVNVLVPEELDYMNKADASLSVIEPYEALVNNVREASTVEEFRAAYKAMREGKAAIEENIAAYAALKATVDEIKTYLAENELEETEDVLTLKDYIDEGGIDPCDRFPNGNFTYIWETFDLNNAQCRAETDFVNALFSTCLKGSYTVGSDISKLIVNAKFANGLNGWEGQGGTGFVTNGADNKLPIVETWRATIDRYQTITGLKNGVYELSMNGSVRPAGKDDSKFYTAYLYANDNMVPIMGIFDDLLPFNDASDMENCYIANAGTYPYDYIWDEEFFYPSSYTGAPFAFLGGRYENTVIVNVTDGTLKVGFKNEGTGSDYDLLWNGNTKLTYLGEVTEGSDYLTDAVAKALEDQIGRATALIEAEASGAEYKFYPNFNQGIKDRLNQLVSQAYEANDAQTALDLIAKFSALYPQILDCQKAYIHMLDLVDQYTALYADQHSAGIINDDKFTELMAELDAATDAFFEGTFTAKQAWDIKFGGKEVGEALIVSAAQLSSNASDRDEGQNIGALIDGDLNTFWHTDWHNVCQDEYHYLQVALRKAFMGTITAKIVRRNSDNDHPTKMKVWSSEDGVNFTELTEISFPFNGRSTTEYSEPFVISSPVRYLRFAATDCGSVGSQEYRKFWHTAEFQLYGESNDPNAADLLDVVFENGTAYDQSPLHNAIQAYGSPSVVYNEAIGGEVFDMTGESVCSTPNAVYSLAVSDYMWGKMADGYTCEAYVCPTFASADNWFSVIGYQQGGGPGLIVDSGMWTFEIHTGGNYRESYATAPVPNEWIHLVGVYDKDNEKTLLYVNGELAGQGAAPGDFGGPSGASPRMFIGSDTNGDGNPEACFQGYIAIARIYSGVKTADEVAQMCKNVTPVEGIAAPEATKSIFNLMGQKVEKAQKGIYIMNGKKILVK